MASIGEMVTALLGNKEPAGPETVRYPTRQPSSYPSPEDVAFARKQDFSYGQPWAREFGGNNLRLLTGDPNSDKALETARIPPEHEPKIFKKMPEIWDVHAQAALASQNSALAQLGYDPNVVALDATRDPQAVNILGRYRKGGSENLDDIYSNARNSSTLAHESLHRGIGRLEGSKYWKPEWDRFGLADRDHELVVRWLMKQKMGDPEAPKVGERVPERAIATTVFGSDSPEAAARRKVLDDMEAAAAKYIAEKRPRGPR